jgi:hypothetical protein
LREPEEEVEFRTMFGSDESNPYPVIEKVRMQRFGKHERMSASVSNTVVGLSVALDNPSRKGARTLFLPRMICS